MNDEMIDRQKIVDMIVSGWCDDCTEDCKICLKEGRCKGENSI